MPHPKEGYKLKDGTPVPGTTTVVGRFKESGALIGWAYNCGKQGIDMRAAKDDAADAGSCAHEMIHAHVCGMPFSYGDPRWTSVTIKRAEHAYLAYLEWVAQSNLKVIAAEQQLVSEKYRFGGCFDAVVRTGNTLSLMDYKTSNAIYSDMLVQVAGGYSLLWQEHHPDQSLHGMDLLRISKPKHPDDPVSFEHRHFSAEVFPICQRAFLLMRELYDLDKRVKGLL